MQPHNSSPLPRDLNANNFTLLRLLLALCVVVSHSFEPTGGEPLVETTGLTLGTHAVFMFFTISGFLVSASLATRSLRDYVISRLLRIYPALIFITLLLALVAGPALTAAAPADYFRDGDLYDFILKTLTQFKSNTTLPGLFISPIGTVWTLRWELILYAVLFALAVMRLFRPAAVLAILAVCIALMLITAYGGVEEKRTMVPRLFTAFFLGSAIYHYRRAVPLRWSWLLAALPLVWLAHGTFLFIPLLVMTECYFALLFALKPWKVVDMETDISYGIYLSGWFPIKAFLLFHPEPERVTLTLFAVIAAPAYGFISWKCVEEPMLKLKRRLVS